MKIVEKMRRFGDKLFKWNINSLFLWLLCWIKQFSISFILPVYRDFTETEARVKFLLYSREWPTVLILLIANSNIHCNESKCKHNIYSVGSDASDITQTHCLYFCTVLFLPCYFLAILEDRKRLKQIKNHRCNSCLPTLWQSNRSDCQML